MNSDIGFKQDGGGAELSVGITGHIPVPNPTDLFRSRRIAPGNQRHFLI
jgi:hypothetical protein